ncbi:MAG: Bug family tripartite tricarboxylate transporter substrate binding protein [bacterium]
MVSKKDFPANDLRSFIATIKERGDKVTEAHAGIASVSHTTCTMFLGMAGAKPTRVAYRGTGPALNDLVAGQVDMGCDQIVNLVPQIQAGTIKAYAIATPERSPALPNVPTTKEAGLPEFEVSAWNAVFAPKNTPREIVARLNEEINRAMKHPDIVEKLTAAGLTMVYESPDYFAELIRSEHAKYGKLVKAIGFKPQ